MSEAVAPAEAGAVTPGLARFAGDRNLARRAAAGDERAFAAIFRRYHQDLYRYCTAILGDPDDAQDALQNAMVKALRALPGESREIELKPWLYRVAHNEAIDLLRRRRGGQPLDPELVAGGPGLAEEAEVRARLGTLLSDLETLPATQRGALVMRELSGLDFEEIATALGTSAATARQTLYEARLSLRQLEAGREMSCDSVTKALSDADGRVLRRRDIRAHLRSCADCRAFRDEIDGRSRQLAALSPLPALAAAGILQGLFGGGGAAGGGLAGGLLGGGAAVGSSAAVKATATVAVVAALGGAAAQRADLVDLGLPVGGAASKSAATANDPSEGSGSNEATTGSRGPAPALEASSRAVPAKGLASAREATAPAARAGAVGADRDRAAAAPAAPVADPTPDSDRSLPEAAAKGQQTAAAKQAGHGKSAAHGKPASAGQGSPPPHAAKPPPAAKPAHPAKPEKAAAPAAAANPGGESAAQAEGTGLGKAPEKVPK